MGRVSLKGAASLTVLAVLASCATVETMSTPGDAIAVQPLPDILNALDAGEVTSEELVATYLDRIAALDASGPELRSVLSVNPDALEEAQALDAERAAGDVRGPLHGAPVLIKDNIETRDALPTTAGSLALADNFAENDAPLIAGLREAGAIILGKANLSEWANFRSTDSSSGWSGLGGQVRNPHVLDRTPCGSSSGSGAAAAAGLAAGTVGTETNGSVICPSTSNGVVGFKPTVGLVSQEGIVPISNTQDTAGPMTRSVHGAALMLTAMATGEGAMDFAAGLTPDALDGQRIGVLRFATGESPELLALFEAALEELEAAGAELVDITEYERPQVSEDQFTVLTTQFRETLNAYLETTPEAVTARSLDELIVFNDENADVEQPLFNQDIFEMSAAAPALDDAAYTDALEAITKATREDGIDHLMGEHEVDMLVSPTRSPAFLIDSVHGDQFSGNVGIGGMAAIAGYPHLTVPMGMVRGLPVGLSFISTGGDDAAVLAAGYAYEERSQQRVEPAFRASVSSVPYVARALRPLSER